MATIMHIHRFTATTVDEPLLAETASSGSVDWELFLTIAATAVGTLIIALVSAWLAWRTARYTERRKLYAEATKAAVAWVELLYRVRRRGSNDEDVVRPLVERFHQAQENLTFHKAWIGSESEHMAASYKMLVDGVKARTLNQINEEWESEPRALPANAVEGDTHPDVSDLTDAFLGDVRSHLSPNPFSKAPSGGELTERAESSSQSLKEGGNP